MIFSETFSTGQMCLSGTKADHCVGGLLMDNAVNDFLCWSLI